MSAVSEDVKCWCGGEVKREFSRYDLYCVESEFHDPEADGRPTEIRRLYIAGPMTGYVDSNYPAFNNAAKELLSAGYEVVNPAGVHLERCHYVDLLREDLRVMLECHGVAVLENWWESAGARNEVMVAGLLRMPVRTFQEWLYIREKLG